MSFEAYLDTIEKKTGRTPRELLGEAKARGFEGPDVKSGDIAAWLAEGYGLGRGHAMALVHVIKNGPTIDSKHVGSAAQPPRRVSGPLAGGRRDQTGSVKRRRSEVPHVGRERSVSFSGVTPSSGASPPARGPHQ